MKNGLNCILVVALGFLAPLCAETQVSRPSLGVVSAEKRVVEAASLRKELSTFVSALKAANLVDMLDEKHFLTVFAPTNEAFEKLPDGTLEMLFEPKNKDKLAELITYHVLNSKVMAESLTTCEVKTVCGNSVTVAVTKESVCVEGANFVATDVPARNGVIHLIDTVLLPKQFMPQEMERLEASSGF